MKYLNILSDGSINYISFNYMNKYKINYSLNTLDLKSNKLYLKPDKKKLSIKSSNTKSIITKF